MRYMVVVEKVLRLIREAIEFHIAGLKEDGSPSLPRSPKANSLKSGPCQ
jgi:predicted RNase H-like HicB family nuclease